MQMFTTNRTVTMRGAALPMSDVGGPLLELKTIGGEEALSKIYTYTLACRTPTDVPAEEAANLDLKSMIGKELTVTIQLDGMGTFMAGLEGMAGAANRGAGTREISGVVAEARYLNQTDRQSNYELSLKPWIWLADQQSDYRIFQRKTVVEIVEDVLGKYMYSYDIRLSRTYPVLDYQVQYGETDFYFIQRLMAEHGIYWFFEHSNTFHRMVLVDHLGAHKPVESAAYQTLWYFPPGHKIDQEYISAFDTGGALQSGRWITSDYDFKKPKADLIRQNELPQDTSHNDLERYEWPGDYTDPSHGEDFARLRMEEVRAHGERASGSGNVRDVVCGTTFHLDGYPRQAANQEYLVISAYFSATEVGDSSGAAEYSIFSSFVVQPAKTVFRPTRDHFAKPRTNGPQTAIVTGPPGQEIWTDQYGRVKLSFRWDRSGVKDHNSSCWIRVSYPWAGGGFGGVNIPRVGTEVIVDFENGDPDRPIVVGRLYNAESMPPWALPGNATQSGILSRSMKGGAGMENGLRMEDKQGAEELWIQAQKDMNTTVKNNGSTSVGNNNSLKVAGNHSVRVKGDSSSEVTGNEDSTVTGTYTQKVTGVVKQTYEAGQTRDITSGGYREDIVGDTKSSITGKWEQTITAASTENHGAGRTVNVTGLDTHNVKGDVEHRATGHRHVSANEMAHSADTTLLMFGEGKADVRSASLVTLGVGERGQGPGISINAGKIELTAHGSTITIDRSGVSVNGSKISLN
ncbi:type VI secretion system Vgr family protein [Paraburkholderia rhizosphaerae]|uniref:Type VI secretion system secreted protein VgrG n=1 Tax=Paraburkholderia rhizosphaerae TaxID=480658 RepID=A0A4R8LBD8_9BURK|nr:type VI secretion system tip protein TssI/VgrG [Paraburkholderia rhizosphaerae]TDY40252.1 type VI secretion system secreted protein VgrG [Paraburkholderia rhizosphaerae]